jgi:hypothetical protein
MIDARAEYDLRQQEAPILGQGISQRTPQACNKACAVADPFGTKGSNLAVMTACGFLLETCTFKVQWRNSNPSK